MRKRIQRPFHLYSVWARTLETDSMVYFGSSKFSAERALASAIMHHDGVLSVDLRRDCTPVLSVKVEHRQEFIVK